MGPIDPDLRTLIDSVRARRSDHPRSVYNMGWQTALDELEQALPSSRLEAGEAPAEAHGAEEFLRRRDPRSGQHNGHIRAYAFSEVLAIMESYAATRPTGEAPAPAEDVTHEAVTADLIDYAGQLRDAGLDREPVLRAIAYLEQSAARGEAPVLPAQEDQD